MAGLPNRCQALASHDNSLLIWSSLSCRPFLEIMSMARLPEIPMIDPSLGMNCGARDRIALSSNMREFVGTPTMYSPLPVVVAIRVHDDISVWIFIAHSFVQEIGPVVSGQMRDFLCYLQVSKNHLRMVTVPRQHEEYVIIWIGIFAKIVATDAPCRRCRRGTPKMGIIINPCTTTPTFGSVYSVKSTGNVDKAFHAGSLSV
jgi:hypothetical protein